MRRFHSGVTRYVSIDTLSHACFKYSRPTFMRVI
jgi:hypothetical protein